MDANEAQLLDRARAAWDEEQWEQSASLYEQLLATRPDDPDSGAWWYDAALAHKFLRNWRKAYELGIEAAARAKPGEKDPAFWNLGIAATIVGDWAVARAAWRDYGIELPPGEGEIEADFGRVCVRLDAGGGRREVVWGRRICPTRVKVTSVPFGDRRYGEIVLHDGDPQGRRIVDGQSYPVFDELLLWKPSQTPTFRVRLSCPAPDDLEALWESLDAVGLTMESMSSFVLHPRAQSEGSIEFPAEEPLAAAGDDVLLPAPDEATARALLDAWVAAGAGRGAHDLRPKEPIALQHSWGHAAGGHALEPHPDWPFPGGDFPDNLGTIAHRSLFEDGALPRLVIHDEDRWWQVLDGVSPAEPEYAAVTCMRCLTEQHPDLAGLADLPPGWAAEREESGRAWRRRPAEADQDADNPPIAGV